MFSQQLLIPIISSSNQQSSNVFEDIFSDPFDNSETTFNPLFEIEEVE